MFAHEESGYVDVEFMGHARCLVCIAPMHVRREQLDTRLGPRCHRGSRLHIKFIRTQSVTNMPVRCMWRHPTRRDREKRLIYVPGGASECFNATLGTFACTRVSHSKEPPESIRPRDLTCLIAHAPQLRVCCVRHKQLMQCITCIAEPRQPAALWPT